jgi:hypothetical protein
MVLDREGAANLLNRIPLSPDQLTKTHGATVRFVVVSLLDPARFLTVARKWKEDLQQQNRVAVLSQLAIF